MEINQAGAAQWEYGDVTLDSASCRLLLPPPGEDAHLPEESEGRVSCQVS